ncbi:MAG: aminomethyl-transferring glycine dehydrogenase [Pseudomonadales bacterium]
MNSPEPATPVLKAFDEAFSSRHIGPSSNEQAAMLNALGFASLHDLMDHIVPPSIRSEHALDLPDSLTEEAALRKLKGYAQQNTVMHSLIGQGYYNCHTPGVILRNVLENPAWYTSYTPYQPEISQGRLEALLNFQTMVCDLTGMGISNASLLDEATAAAEAMTLAKRVSKSKSSQFFIDHQCLPQTIAVLQTRAEHLGIDLVIGNPDTDSLDQEFFGVLLQYPGVDGAIRSFKNCITAAHNQKAVVVMAADILSLTLLKSPAELGADIAVGNTQRFGVPLGFGGPHAAYMACDEKYKRSLPGRIVGVSVDQHGNKAYRLALQTREQHIRREKATSNICTAQALLAIMASCFAVYHGADGLRRIAQRTHYLTQVLHAGFGDAISRTSSEPFFDTLSVSCKDNTLAIHERAIELGINLRHIDENTIGVSLDETCGAEQVEAVWQAFGISGLSFATVAESVTHALPEDCLRSDDILTHPVFSQHQTETEMLRYLRALADKDIALDRAMIPLGSCTMKLNASSEMFPISWPEFASIHPFAPAEQTLGYRHMIEELEQQLCAVTGYDAVSLQPNAGSQGEYAGLLAIKAYHQSNGEPQRSVCLIPGSAHGTNPASAQMCGMSIQVVKCDEQGNVDLEDLKEKAQANSNTLAAIMITYPSTHGVFEAHVREVCEVVHQYGGQVYIDGANLNAMVGLCYPGEFGGDVSHLNLHKTFCIPHGGGGPGVGPVAVRSHLAPHLPGHSDLPEDYSNIGPVSAAAWGSAGILPISWMYVTMMGATGLRQATEVAMLSANYIAKRLHEHYPILYVGEHGLVAHECILDLRPLKEHSGVDVEDVAKRLIDYGFHAPTMSFPVAGTLMVEPTESESLAELDRFCDAMISIREEIRAIENDQADASDNVLMNAPHSAEHLLSTDWQHPYTREQAAYPLDSLRTNKYFSPVGRVDNVFGDRNLVCSCPPISDYQD